MAEEIAPPLILTGGAQLNQTPLTPEERKIFFRDLRRIAQIYSLSAELSALLLEDAQAYLVAAQVAKATLGTNLVFAGLSASGSAQLGMQLIRAVTVMNVGITTGTPVLTWNRTFTSTGWQNLFGSPANPVSLAQFGLGGTSATNLNGRVVLAFSAFLETAPTPVVAEYRVHVGNTDYQVHPITWLPATNVFFARLEGVFLITKNNSFYVRGNIQPSAGVTSNLQLFGLTFATGDYLAAET